MAREVQSLAPKFGMQCPEIAEYAEFHADMADEQCHQ